MALLGQDAETNSSIIKSLKATGVLGVQGAGLPAGTASIRLTAKTAIGDYNSNSFAFNRKYGNKNVSMTGYVVDVSGAGNTATVELVGYPHKDLSKSGFEALIRCDVETPAALNQAAKLRAGHRATVQGIVNVHSGLAGIDIKPCLATNR